MVAWVLIIWELKQEAGFGNIATPCLTKKEKEIKKAVIETSVKAWLSMSVR